MPLFSEHISNMYYTPTYTSLPYSYSSPYGSSYSASYLNPGGNYSSHSSIGGYSRTPISSRWIGGRSYAPMLSTISEKGTSSPVRISSPRRIPVTTRSYTTSYYPTTRPININTADIDVSSDRYRNKLQSSSSPRSVSKRSPSIEREINSSTSQVTDKPKTGVDTSPGKQRSTIKRDRPVVRLHTVKRKDRDSPRKPVDASPLSQYNSFTSDDKTKEIEKSEAVKWRERLAEDLEYKDKKEKKSIAEKLVEKFTLKVDIDTETNNNEVINTVTEPTNTECKKQPAAISSRRFSMEMLAEQSTLLDSLIRRENLSTASLDLSKIGTEKENLGENDIKKRKFVQTNPITTTKSDHSLNCRSDISKKLKNSINKKSLRKSSSGDSICKFNISSEIIKNLKSDNLPTIDEKVLRNKNNNQESKDKTIQKQRITSSVDVSSPLKFIVENVTVEEKPLQRKKDIVYSSVIEESYAPNNCSEVIKSEPIEIIKLKIKPKPEEIENIKTLESPEPEDGNFWNKIGKRETVYLMQRKQEIDKKMEKNKRLVFWFPDVEDTKLESDQEQKDTSNINIQKEIDNLSIQFKDVVERDKSKEDAQSLSFLVDPVNKTLDEITLSDEVREDKNVKLNKDKNTQAGADVAFDIDSVSNTNNLVVSNINKQVKMEIKNGEALELLPNDFENKILNKIPELVDINTKADTLHNTKPKSVQKIRKSKEKLSGNSLKCKYSDKNSSKSKEVLKNEETNPNDSNKDYLSTQKNILLSETIVKPKDTIKGEKQMVNVVETSDDFGKSKPVVIVNLDITQSNAILSEKTEDNRNCPKSSNKKNVLHRNSKRVSVKKPVEDMNLLLTNKRLVKDVRAPVPLIATPRPLQKKNVQVIRSSSSSESSSSDESSEEEESSESSNEYYETENNLDGRTSTGSNDSGFDSSAPVSPSGFSYVKKDCDVNCHRKCEKLTANLCGVNQRLLVEALGSRTASKRGADHPSTSSGTANAQSNTYIVEQELEQSTAYEIFRKTGRFTPPARTIPRFRKYTIDDFQFIKVLGKGSFGKVMLAELRDTEYYYAVKCLKKDVVLEDDDVECTLIERKVLALGTNHPYLCHLFATFQTDSHLFFVMEYLNGGDLMFHIQQSGRFPEPRARFYAAEIVSGLKFLHKRGIVYRDLKLDNILLDFDGHVRIADFGMCKLQIYLDKTADTFCGTPDYMAPEIIKGLKYNQAVDWWSFGVLLYEMLIGQSPFSGCDEDELFWSICNEMPSYPRFLSSESLSILTRLLDKDARTRLGGAECMHGDIKDQEFFRLITWEKLERRELETPFKPKVRHPLDTQYFDRAFTGERPRLTTVEPQVLRTMDQEPFRGFSYTNPNATDR
ncbi:uncharacterized protein LOC126967638 isoform X1 [Leptidea sinapis]|uniref:uncharacterized protein LOC126967638 isoform X1 n=1 Tax=Leptidea sinapis TaxID=189913 RepID=UPI002123856F|nr:uncharacterized protein LOC126967638 isoform X1 [Leptidea sinapis]